MEKNIILNRLQMTIDKLKTLNESQYLNCAGSGYVKTIDRNGMPLCADVVGWYPDWFEDSNVRMQGKGIKPVEGLNVPNTLKIYHGVKVEIVYYLFYRKNLESVGADSSWTLQETINKWIACKYSIENDLIAYN